MLIYVLISHVVSLTLTGLPGAPSFPGGPNAAELDAV